MKHTKKAVVIGAGIAGCSTAYALAKRGVAVTIIERHQTIAQEGSGNPVGMLYPKFNTGRSLLSEMATRSFAFTLALLEQLPSTETLYALCGQIQLAFNAQEQAKHTQFINTFNHDDRYRQLSPSQASQKANIDLRHGGLYLPNSGWVKPKAFCHALINSTAIACLIETQAINIKKHDHGWQVILQDHPSIEADIVVLCNANDIQQFTPCANIPITSVRGQVNFFNASELSLQLKTVVCSDHYLSPAVDGMHSIGTSYGPNDMNAAVSQQDTMTNLQALKKISPALFEKIEQSTVTGRVAWRCATRDYFPLAGQLVDEIALREKPPRYNDNPANLPWLKGLYINAGHGSKGMITAPICGELIACLANQEPLPLQGSIASTLNPSRFLLRDLGLKRMAQNLY